MDKFEQVFARHHAVKSAYSSVYIRGCEWGFKAGQQSRQAEVDELNQLYFKAQHQEIRHRTIAQDALTLVEEKDKRINELEKTEFALAKVKQILNKHIKTRLLESIIVRELIDLLFSNKG